MANRQDAAYVRALARSLYWGFSKETTGEPGRLADLDNANQKFWISMAKRAIRRIEELDTSETTTS